MRRIRDFIFLYTGLLLWMACTTEDNRNVSLQNAIQTVDINPQEALQLLENISDPLSMDKNSYMHYIVALTQAKFMDDQDITLDSLILEAQCHFVETGNNEMSARASYYSSGYWHRKEDEEKALKYALLAYHFAQQAGNNLFRAKGAHWVGSIYYNQGILDSAKGYYLQALESYTNEANTELHRLDLIYMLGQTDYKLKQFSQALNYFNDGMEAALQLKNQPYEAMFTHYKGIIFREKKEYEKAKTYFGQALYITADSEDSLRIYLSYAKLYKATNQPDSTIYYLNLVENRISEITYSYTRRAIFQELANYYKIEGNVDKLHYYSKLYYKEDKKISNFQNEENMFLVTKRTNERFKEQIQAKNKSNRLIINLSGTIGVLFLLVLLNYRSEKFKLRNRYNTLCKNQVIQRLDLSNFLLGGLRTIAKSMEFFNEKKQNLCLVSVGKEFQMLREKFNAQIAELGGNMLKQFYRGAIALPKLNDEDLCIMYLTQMNYSIETIGWMLGYKTNIENFIKARKKKIRQILAESGMKEQDVNVLFIPILPTSF